MATSFLRFCKSSNGDGMAFASAAGAGSLGKGCATGKGSMWTELRGRGKLFCSSTASSVSNRGTASFFSHG